MQKSCEGQGIQGKIDRRIAVVSIIKFEERKQEMDEKKHLLAYRNGLQEILKDNPYLAEKVGCGYQDFQDFACGRQFYVDKTHFIT